MELNDRGIAFIKQGDTQRALDCFFEAIRLDPLSGDAISNTATALVELNRFEEALPFAQKAVTLTPTANAYGTLGICFYRLARFEEAAAMMRQSLALEPSPMVEYHLGWALLGCGQYKEGWRQFEWRKKTERWAERVPLDVPDWDGRSGKNLLLFHEQGFGDTLMLARFIPQAIAASAECYLLCPPELVSLFAVSFPSLMVFSDIAEIPPVDVQCSLYSLPYLFEITLANLPAAPYLTAPSPRIERWSQRLSHLDDRKIGIVWSSNPRPNTPTITYLQKSTPLVNFLNLRDIPNITLISLQHGAAATEARDVLGWTDELCEFADTAALIMNLDMVITVDTSVAHLAGALGKPVWLLNRYDTCWRWQTDQWYPSTRIFRQAAIGDWDSVFRAVRSEIQRGATVASVLPA